MVSNYKLSELRKFMRDIDQIMAEAWMILAESPCILYAEPVRFDEEVIESYLSFNNEVKWTCSVVMSVKLASYLARQFYDDEDELDDEIVSETVGEFINIIAGNIQGVLEGSAYLSSPTTTVHPDDSKIGYQGIRRNYQTPTGEFVITLNGE